ncbi:12068_t:CDS:2, partial [Racocetra persica]
IVVQCKAWYSKEIGQDKIDKFRTVVLDGRYAFGVYVGAMKGKFANGAYKLAKRSGGGCKIAQVATEKCRFDMLDTFNQILEELYKTDESIDKTNRSTNELGQRTINNPYIVKSKGRPQNKRFKSFVKMSQTFKNSSSGSN